MGNILMSSLAYRFYVKIELPVNKNNKVYRWYNFVNR
jgi:hypothetical protein